MIPNPCKKDCPKRSSTCHANCPDYALFRADCDERNRNRAKEIESRPFSHDLEMKYRKNLKAGRKRA